VQGAKVLSARSSAVIVYLRQLTLAADQYIVRANRRANESKTVIRRISLFSDWGRDTMIALPALRLATGRHDDARSHSETFAASLDMGCCPTVSLTTGEAPEYNTVDATLWFFPRCHQYLEATGDESFIRETIYPKLLEFWNGMAEVRVMAYAWRAMSLHAGETGVQLT